MLLTVRYMHDLTIKQSANKYRQLYLAMIEYGVTNAVQGMANEWEAWVARVEQIDQDQMSSDE